MFTSISQHALHNDFLRERMLKIPLYDPCRRLFPLDTRFQTRQQQDSLPIFLTHKAPMCIATCRLLGESQAMFSYVSAFLRCATVLVPVITSTPIKQPAPYSGRLELTALATNTASEGSLSWVETDPNTKDSPFAILAAKSPLVLLDHASLATKSTGHPSSLKAKIWLGMDTQALFLRVSVMDAKPFNPRANDKIWDGDSIQVSLNTTTVRSPWLGTDADVLPPGAFVASFAQTSQGGAQGWVHTRGNGEPAGPFQGPMHIVHDTARSETLYEISIPFGQLNAVAGISDKIGFGIRINDSSEDTPFTEHLVFGGGPSGTLRPQRLSALSLAPLPRDYTALDVTRTQIWQDGDAAEAVLVTRVPDALELHATWREQRHHISLPAISGALGAEPETRRWAIRFFGPPDCTHTLPIEISVTDANGRIHAQTQRDITCPRGEFDRIQDALQSRIAAPNIHPLEQKMRHAQLALLQTAWSKADTLLPESAYVHQEVLQAAQTVAQGIDARPESWDEYVHGERPLTLSFVASADSSLQPMGLRLPKHWTPERPQPVIVFLHGKGDPRMTQFLSDLTQKTGLPFDDAYVLSPWGRGIMGYQGLAEQDVLEALQAASRIFNFDKTRTYIMGFSMGGAGAWNFALHQPDPWAAVAIASGGTWLTSLGVGLGRNAKDLPIGVWHGDADSVIDVSEAYKMQQEIEQSHGQIALHIRRAKGHEFDDSMLHTLGHWLLQHQHSQTTSFSYLSDDWWHRARRGIRLNRDTHRAVFPFFTCRLTPGHVYIDSTATSGLDVDMGQFGLNLSGKTTVHWNGKKVYQGPPTQLTLGTGAGRY